uniref:CCHC-type domain-containing protein n=1 Tax=Erpetoichthys calabaricus TaxID=27687 RepID=A0A8C4S1W5_ERPCA
MWFCLRVVEKEKLVNPVLEKFLILPLIDRLDKKLLQYCDLYKFDIVLKKENDTERVIHLPPVIQIGTVRGHVFYPGQPQVCRRCGNEGHKAADCAIIKCRNCKEEGHFTRDCRKPIKCSLCGQEAHVFKDSPVSYANMVRRNVRREEKAIALLDEESEEEKVNRRHRKGRKPRK